MSVQNLQGPYTYAFDITANDTATLANVTHAVLAKQTGNLNAVFLGGGANANSPNIVLSITAGVVYPFRLVKVYSTGTNANVIGLL